MGADFLIEAINDVATANTRCHWSSRAMPAGISGIVGDFDVGGVHPSGARKNTCRPPPPVTCVTVSSISPTIGNSAGGQSVTVTGTNFRYGATLNLGGALAKAKIDPEERSRVFSECCARTRTRTRTTRFDSLRSCTFCKS